MDKATLAQLLKPLYVDGNPQVNVWVRLRINDGYVYAVETTATSDTPFQYLTLGTFPKHFWLEDTTDWESVGVQEALWGMLTNDAKKFLADTSPAMRVYIERRVSPASTEGDTDTHVARYAYIIDEQNPDTAYQFEITDGSVVGDISTVSGDTLPDNVAQVYSSLLLNGKTGALILVRRFGVYYRLYPDGWTAQIDDVTNQYLTLP